MRGELKSKTKFYLALETVNIFEPTEPALWLKCGQKKLTMLRIFSSSYSNLVSECFMNTVIFDFFVKTFKELRAGVTFNIQYWIYWAMMRALMKLFVLNQKLECWIGNSNLFFSEITWCLIFVEVIVVFMKIPDEIRPLPPHNSPIKFSARDRKLKL